jgi:excisionase family DNA binding protein
MEKVFLLQSDDNQFIDKLAERVAEKLKSALTKPEITPKQEKIYLTRKQTAKKLGISPPTVDQLVADNVLTKLGTGKRGRFRLEDIENLYENFDKYYRRQRKNTQV